MDGYLRPRLVESPMEVRELELEETEFVPDDEPDFERLIKQNKNQCAYMHACPRCASRSRIVGNHPYCPDCNWDSLLDLKLGSAA